MFSKVLIANRGEIAVRVIKTCRRLGISTVVVYSDADAGSRAVEMADEAVHIGPSPAAQSYLRMDAIIEAAKATGAQAIHPGFGFLSENAEFARKLAKENIVFIGPNPGAIEAMGDKITSKEMAKNAGVSTVPGHMGLIDDADHAVKIAGEIGYPVMIKASAGGGGKGMRVAYSDQEAREGFQSAKNEAKSSFGDDRIFIEKFVESPRHIEIQVLGDKHGHIIHLGERECSIQRRNQKVIEEAPSPFIDEATRKAMGAQAIALAKAVDYDSAGTVEFIVDKDKNFYFLEMNTRLQVEHPVTEMITGLDLVEQMLRVADGEKLSLNQKAVKFNGWAIECRIYAEDPYRGFLPSIGRLNRCRPPAEGKLEGATVRVDSGVEEGDVISLFYDPMIAKLVTHGPDRRTAIDGALAALDRYDIAGIQDNRPFLSALLSQERFRQGRLTTGYIAEEFPDGFSGAELSADQRKLFIAAAGYAHATLLERASKISGRINSRTPPEREKWTAIIERKLHPFEIDRENGRADIMLETAHDRFMIETDWRPGETLFEARIDGVAVALNLEPQREGYAVSRRGARAHVIIASRRAAELHALLPEKETADAGKTIASPMPGLIVSIDVEAGQEVEAGHPLLVVEAMKMENVIRAERSGVVKSVEVEAGASVAADDVLVEFE